VHAWADDELPKFGVYFWLFFLNDHTFQSIYYPRRWDGKWTTTTNANIYGSTDILKEKQIENIYLTPKLFWGPL